MNFFTILIPTLMILSAKVADCHYLNFSKLANEDADVEPYYPPAGVDDYRSSFSYLPEYNGESETENNHERFNRDLRRERYESLCLTKTKILSLSDDEYEYQPPNFAEVYCKNHPAVTGNSSSLQERQVCVIPNFHCIQRAKTILFVRRLWDSECWEPVSRQVAIGCECMWPTSFLGDITIHHG